MSTRSKYFVFKIVLPRKIYNTHTFSNSSNNVRSRHRLSTVARVAAPQLILELLSTANLCKSCSDVGRSFGSLSKQAFNTKFISSLNQPAFILSTENPQIVELSCGNSNPPCFCLYATAVQSLANALLRPVVANLNRTQPSAQMSAYLDTVPSEDRPSAFSINSGARYASVPRPCRD